MTWYAVYDNATGQLRATGTTLPDVLPDGLASKSYAENIQAPGKQWNEAARDFEDVAVPKPKVDAFEFKRRFTIEEHAALISAANANAFMAAFMNRLDTAKFIGTDDPETVAGINLIVGLGIISTERASEILE